MKKQTIRSLSAAVAMSLIVGASLVACGGKSTSTAAAASVTKTGTGKGFGGDIVATLTVESDGTVSDCKLEGASETESLKLLDEAGSLRLSLAAEGIFATSKKARHTAICRQKSATFCEMTLEKAFSHRPSAAAFQV